MANWSLTSALHGPQSAATERQLRPDIQGLRGLAVLLVVLYHAGVPATPGGFVGVDVFFVISGFLITGLLTREVEASGRIRYVNFIARRARRLLPAALFVIGFVGLASIHVYPPLERLDVVSSARAASLYVANLWFAIRTVDYFAAAQATSPMLHMWSLSVEEQFYLVWPALIALAVTARQIADVRLRIAAAVVATSCASLALCVWMTRHAQPWAFFGTPFRAWEFGLGALIYLGADRIARWPEAALSRAGIVGLVLVLGSAVAFDDTAPFPGFLALVPTAGTALILASLQAPGMARTLLSARPLARIGDVSYSWYLWHWPLLVFVPLLLPQYHGPALLAAVLASYAMAEFSYRFVEEPFRHGFAARLRPRLVVLSACGLTIGMATSLTVFKMAASSGELNDRQREFIEARRDKPPAFLNGCLAGFTKTQVSECETGTTGSTRIAVLIGDSHAAHWQPALESVATKQGWKLVTMMKIGCPWVDVTVRLSHMRREYSECNVWRAGVFKRVAEIRPELIFLSSTFRREVGQELWEAGARRSALALAEGGTRIILIRDTPQPGFDVPTCLARAEHIGLDPSSACTFSLTAQLEVTAQAFEAERRALAGLRSSAVVDMTDHLCPRERCAVTSSGVVHFSDYSHLTATFSRQAGPALSAKLDLTRASPPF